MSHKISSLKFVYLLICLAVLLGACANPTPSGPTPTPNLPYYPGCSADNLIAYINFANANNDPDIIHLDPGCTYMLTSSAESEVLNNQTHHSGLPTIITDITIYGHDAKIRIRLNPGEPPTGHFYVDGSGENEGDLKLYDLRLENGIRQIGGAVIVHQADFFASNTAFLDNGVGPMDLNDIQPGLGGAIYNLAGSVTIIDQSSFGGNYASKPPDRTDELGGVIYNKNGDLLVYSSSFIGNQSAGRAGAIYSEKDAANLSAGLIIIENSKFFDNVASRDGGAIVLVNETNGATFITDSIFYANRAEYGGAIFSEGSKLKVDFDFFYENSADFGGAIYTKRSGGGNPSTLSSQESTYEENMVRDLGIGGAIFSENSDLFLDESEFRRNTASSCGAIRIGGHPYLEGETWEPGAELSTDLYNPASIEISGGKFRNNQAWHAHGGAICHLQGELSIQETWFIDNEANEHGGALFLIDKSELSELLLTDNIARGSGGAAAIGYPSYIDQIPGEFVIVDPTNLNFSTHITNTIIRNNTGGSHGAGLYINIGGRVSISKSTVKENVTNYWGGGIFQEGGDLVITNSTFSANSASKGGGLYNTGCSSTQTTLDIKHSTFAHNIASDSSEGGGLQYMGEVNIQNSLVTLNSNQDCGISQCSSSNVSVAGSVDSDGSCGFSVTETDPKIGPLSKNGGATQTHALQSDSPLINTAPDCALLQDDQRGVHRPQPQGGNCDPGAYEFYADDPRLTPPPPPAPPPPMPDVPPDDSSENCPPFEDLDISVVLLNVPADTLVLPLYFKFLAGVPGQDEAEPWKFRATLGDPGEIESYKCDQQGFEDRLYCMFNLTPDAPGLALDLLLYKDDCEDPSYTLPKVTIPEIKGSTPDSIPDPKLQCSKDLNKDACEAAGGEMSTGGSEAPHCICP